MPNYIAILRGINVGGRRKILMADLKSYFRNLGFQEVQTYIQSGNVLFSSNQDLKAEAIENLLEAEILKSFGFEVPVIVRTSDQLKKAINNNPFYKSTDVDIERLHLTLLKQDPSQENLDKLKDFKQENDDFKIENRNVFVYCSGKYSDSKFSNKFFESKLKVTATTRNWKTILKLAEMLSD